MAKATKKPIKKAGTKAGKNIKGGKAAKGTKGTKK